MIASQLPGIGYLPVQLLPGGDNDTVSERRRVGLTMQHVTHEPGALGQIVRTPIRAAASVEDIIFPEYVPVGELTRGHHIELIAR